VKTRPAVGHITDILPLQWQIQKHGRLPTSVGADLEEEQGVLGALEAADLLLGSHKMCLYRAGYIHQF
jgi:hypothetical protein